MIKKESNQYDVIVIGSGAAGLSLALKVATHARILILSKTYMENGSTRWAQGGISCVLDPLDHFQDHIEDTLIAGDGLCQRERVEQVVKNAPQAIKWLEDLGVELTKNQDQSYHLTMEGGHRHRRIVHRADTTGESLQKSLLSQAQKHTNITLLDHHICIDLITKNDPQTRCVGVYALNVKKEKVITFQAKMTVLATGGASKVYRYTSNPDGSTGDGMAMAWRAGCRMANMEFTQFHPTCLYHPDAKNFLISEALRGEGAHLKLPNGQTFMKKFHPQGDLAPRDIVARAIDHEIKRLGIDHVYLDISHRPKSFILKHFPAIHTTCLSYGIDITCDPIPVVPAAHYTCGGIMVDHFARTDIQSLYAIGECAYTGLHGANRLASNSLIECLVFAQACSQDILDHLTSREFLSSLEPWDESWVTNSDEEILVSHNWEELRNLMWDFVSIIRTTKRLERAQNRIAVLKQEINQYYHNFRVTPDLLELRNLVVISDLIIQSALQRKESRGLHYTSDYPDKLEPCHIQNTIIIPPNAAARWFEAGQWFK